MFAAVKTVGSNLNFKSSLNGVLRVRAEEHAAVAFFRSFIVEGKFEIFIRFLGPNISPGLFGWVENSVIDLPRTWFRDTPAF